MPKISENYSHFSRWTWVSQYQNVAIIDFTRAKDGGVGGIMHICDIPHTTLGRKQLIIITDSSQCVIELLSALTAAICLDQMVPCILYIHRVTVPALNSRPALKSP